MCRQQRGARTESAVRYGCGPTRGEKESAERAAVSISGTEVPVLQASVQVSTGVALADVEDFSVAPGFSLITAYYFLYSAVHRRSDTIRSGGPRRSSGDVSVPRQRYHAASLYAN